MLQHVEAGQHKKEYQMKIKKHVPKIIQAVINVILFCMILDQCELITLQKTAINANGKQIQDFHNLLKNETPTKFDRP